MKTTAIQWLENNMPDLSMYIPLGLSMQLHAIFQQAKEMEKEQIQDAYYVGDKNGCGCYDYCTKEDAKDYYNENYENNRL